MDRRRAGSPVYSRQWSGASSSTGSSSPSMSPAHPSSRTGATTGISTVKRTQNVAAKAAAQRLAMVMASRTADEEEEEEEEEEEDDLVFGDAPPLRYPSSSLPAASNNNNVAPAVSLSRLNRTPSPALGRNLIDHTASVRSASTGRPSVSVRSTPLVPPSKTSLRVPVPIPSVEPPVIKHRERRLPSDLGSFSSNDAENQSVASALRDELDMLHEENEIILDKLRHAEERREQAEARAGEFEKQVANLGEGVSLEAKLLSRKEAALRKREDALKAAAQNYGKDGEIAALHTEIKNLKEGTETAVEQLQEAESEVKALRSMTQRMILTQEEMEEVVLKRCWLSRYWGLALQHGIHPEIAVSKHEHWSSLAPLPFEVVISAGQKAKEESLNKGMPSGDELHRQDNLVRDFSDLTGEGNIESMLSVEMGLRELSSLKVEDSTALALAQHRRPSLMRQSISDPKLPSDARSTEVFELSREESEDVHFKEAWLTYFWKRAKIHKVEEDIAEERVMFWVGRSGQSPTSHDVVDVERGLIELRKLGIEQQLWEASRKEIEP